MDLVTWLPTAVGSALGFVLWHKLDKMDSKVDRLFETELREMDARLTVIETHLGIKGPNK